MNIKRLRLEPSERADNILAAAVAVALREGFRGITRDQVAAEANSSVGLIYTYYRSMDSLRDEVMRVAVRDKHLAIVAQGVASGNVVAARAPAELRRAALQTLA